MGAGLCSLAAKTFDHSSMNNATCAVRGFSSFDVRNLARNVMCSVWAMVVLSGFSAA